MKKYYPILLLLLFISCSQDIDRQKWQQIQQQPVSATLEGKILQRNTEIWSPYIKFFLDDTTIMTCCYICRDTVYQMYRIKGDTISDYFKFGRYGNGPNELLDIAVCKDDSGNNLFIYECLSSRIRAYKVNIVPTSSCDGKDSVSYTKILFPYKNDFLYDGIVPFGEKNFIALGGDINQFNLLTLMDLERDTVIAYNIDVPDKCNDASPYTRNFVYRFGNIYKRKNHKQILYFGRYGRHSEIINFDENDSIKNRILLASDYPYFKDDLSHKGMPVFYGETYRGIKGAVTEKRVYLIPEPYTLDEYDENKQYKGYPKKYGDKLYIFDWDGNFIKSYMLSIPVERFIVSSDDSYLLGSTINLEADDEYEFVKFELPK